MTAAVRTIAQGYVAEPQVEGRVIPFPRRAWRDGGANGRRRRRGGRVIMWPHPYRPRQAERIDAAVAWAWRQHSAGVIDDVECHVRLEELRAMRGWMA